MQHIKDPKALVDNKPWDQVTWEQVGIAECVYHSEHIHDELIDICHKNGIQATNDQINDLSDFMWSLLLETVRKMQDPEFIRDIIQ